MLTLIKNVECYAPSPQGSVDILIANNAIAHIAPDISLTSSLVNVIDGSNLIALPGLVDSLVHISGGGGEGGVPRIFSNTYLPRLTGEVRLGSLVIVRMLA